MKRRIIAFVIDLDIAGFITSPVMLLGNNRFYILMSLVLLLFRDLTFKNASIGKKIVKLEILDKNGEKPKPIKLIFRNLTNILYPIEFLSILIAKERITDGLLDLKVVEKVS